MRKTRKYPNMFGSIRKYKRDLRHAKKFDKWYNTAFSKDSCELCVSEPICLNSNR